MHDSEIDRPAAIVIGLPIGKWVQSLDDPCGGNTRGGEGCTCPPPF
jgi:hypothetical protein